ncbi:MAG: GH25 family lysozyme [Propionibacterium sp.]|nr:GH25 family lysozyme [Propionibacterium sp.]
MTDTIIADVSEFQQVIDWPTYGAHVPGVIIRAHNGNRPDAYWQRNLAGARANVTWRGFYQYLPANVDPAAAARAFTATIGQLEPGEVVILDLEEGSGDQRARRQLWLDTMQAPIEWTYSGLYFARSHLPGVSIEWIAAYQSSEPTDAHTLWQFTNAHTFPGIARPCDASVFHGTILPGLTGSLGRSIGSGTGAVLTPGITPTPGAEMTPDETRILNEADQNAFHSWVTALATRAEVQHDAVSRYYTKYLGREGTVEEVASQVSSISDTHTLDNVRWEIATSAEAVAHAAAVAAAKVAPAQNATALDPAALASALATIHATTTLTTGA